MSKKFALAGAKNNSKISDFFGKLSTKKSSLEVNNKTTCDLSNDDVIVIESETEIKISNGHSNENVSPNRGPQSSKTKSETTPVKGFKSPRKSPKASSGSKRTPRSTTPKKLFEKSPRKLQEFNVVVLEQFVQISPSTSNPTAKSKGTPNKRVAEQNCRVTSSSEYGDLYKTPTKRIKLDFADSAEKPVAKHESSDSTKVASKIQEKINEIMPEQNKTQPEKQQNLDEYELSYCLDFDEDFDDVPKETNSTSKVVDTLVFEKPQHCTVIEMNRRGGKVVLRLKSTKNGQIGSCTVTEFWAAADYPVGTVVYINATKSSNDEWIVSNDQGYIVYEPELLISSTSVVRSIFCKRKSVLGEYYRGFEGGNKHMAIGTLIHSLLQIVLKRKLKNSEQISAVLKELLARKETIKYLYESNVKMDEIEAELSAFVPRIVDFLEDYVNVKKIRIGKPGNWKGRICDIADIEENLWCPDLGVKGKIDVSLGTGDGVKPLELKTGKATVSLEHRGQVILYIMMMNKFGYEVSSGLLLYLKEGVLKEVAATPHEKRDIMLLRNELVYYLTKKNRGELNIPQLPPPIDRHNICKSCAFNVICTSFLKYESHDLSQNTSIQKVQDAVTSHLAEEHLEYFKHWTSLLVLEEESRHDFKSLKDIYTSSPTDRERRGRSVANVNVIAITPELNGICEHTFEKSLGELNLLVCGIQENHYVVVSTDERPAVAAGFVTALTATTISIALDRNLDAKYKGKTFHLDTYDSSSAYSFNLSSLSLLLENTPRSAELRGIIVSQKAPEFAAKLPAIVAKKGATILRKLNPVQQRAILRAISAKDFLLIKGMPGTGKTSTIVALIEVLVALNKTVLLTSHTHSAIDNVCMRLKKAGVDLLRLGAHSRIADGLKEYAESAVLERCSSVEELEGAFNQFNVVAVTCLGSSHPLLSKRTFDYCIVDESTQVLQPAIIKPISTASTFVLIGDPDQLPPVVRNVSAIKLGMADSLFHRLNENPTGTIALTLNYRMNQVITDLANAFTYRGELKTGNCRVANQTLVLPNIHSVKSEYKDKQWLLKLLNPALEASVQVVDVGSVWQHSSQNTQNQCGSSDSCQKSTGKRRTCVNVHEIAVIKVLIDALIKAGVSPEDVGIIAPYRAQVAELSALLAQTGVEVNTIDQFQGRDKNVVIFSCTKSSGATYGNVEFEILEDKRRLTVAITRAKQKLILIGDLTTLRRYTTFSALLDCLDSNNFIVFGDESDPKWDILKESLV